MHKSSHCSRIDKLVKETAAGQLCNCRADMATGNGMQRVLQHMGEPDAWQYRTRVITVGPSSSVLSHGFNHHEPLCVLLNANSSRFDGVACQLGDQERLRQGRLRQQQLQRRRLLVLLDIAHIIGL